MARNVSLISIFLASPSDLETERELLKDIVDELNWSICRGKGVRVDLLRWETHSFPGMGVDPQAVINDQIPDDYDIFIGLMWSRYGTPTKRAGSGTEEEFRRALARYRQNDESVKIMFYFKDAALPPSQLDPTQIQKIQQFKRELGEEGALYCSFKETQDFGSLVRMHLIIFIEAWVLRDADLLVTQQPSHPSVETPPEVDDPGFLDCIEKFQAEFDSSHISIGRIQSAIQELGAEIGTRTKELGDLRSKSTGADLAAAEKRVINRSASDLGRFSRQVDIEIPLLRDSLTAALGAFVQAMEVSVDLELSLTDIEHTEVLLQAIGGAADAISEAVASTVEFRESVLKLPRMTTMLNRAKFRAVKSIDDLIEELEREFLLFCEAKKSVQSRLDLCD